jgi:hypothetical protein
MLCVCEKYTIHLHGQVLYWKNYQCPHLLHHPMTQCLVTHHYKPSSVWCCDNSNQYLLHLYNSEHQIQSLANLTYSRTAALLATCFQDGFMLSLFFDSEDGDNMFLWNVGRFQQTIWRYIPEDSTLHNHCCENLKCYLTYSNHQAKLKSQCRHAGKEFIILWTLFPFDKGDTLEFRLELTCSNISAPENNLWQSWNNLIYIYSYSECSLQCQMVACLLQSILNSNRK